MLPALFSRVPSIDDLGSWTSAQLVPLFQSFKGDEVAPALALIIFSAAMALCLLFLLNSYLIRAQIWRRFNTIQKIKTKTEFSAAMPRIQKLMQGSKYLRHSWDKFRETLIGPSEEYPEIFNTARPQVYFNSVEAGLRFPIFRAMPNLLVGIGLLLTFVGLVSALYFTTDAINRAGDLKASQEALKNLLHAASFKFYTSVAGLGGSIIMTLVLRYGTSKIDVIFDKLANALESKLVFITPESIAFKHYSEAQEQTRNLKLFNTEVAVSIGQHIEEALATTLPNQLAQALAPLTQTLHELASKLTSTNQRAIGDFANEFAHRLEANTGEHLQSLATTLGNLSVSLQDLESRLNNSGSGLAQNVKESSETMGNFIGSMETAARSIRDAAMPLTENSRLVGEASQRLVDATHNIEQIVGNTQNAVQEICDVLRTTLETTAGQWKDYEERFQEVDESLASVLDQITSTVQRTTESLGDFVKKIDEKFSGAIDKLGGGIEELNEFAQSIEQVTHRFDGQDRHQVSPK